MNYLNLIYVMYIRKKQLNMHSSVENLILYCGVHTSWILWDSPEFELFVFLLAWLMLTESQIWSTVQIETFLLFLIRTVLLVGVLHYYNIIYVYKVLSF